MGSAHVQVSPKWFLVSRAGGCLAPAPLVSKGTGILVFTTVVHGLCCYTVRWHIVYVARACTGRVLCGIASSCAR